MLAAHLTLAQFVGYGERAPATWCALVLLVLLSGGCQAATQGRKLINPACEARLLRKGTVARHIPAPVRFPLHVGGYSQFLGAKAR
jgi:hypothetical protein